MGGWVVAGGIFVGDSFVYGGSGKFNWLGYFTHWNFNNTLTQPGSKILAPNHYLYIWGNWTNNGGRFIHNNKTVVFNGTGDKVYNANIQDTFYNVIIDKTTSTKDMRVNAGDTLYVLNKLTLLNGDFRYNGAAYSAYVRVDDTLDVEPGMDVSTMNFIFGGAKDGHFILNQRLNTFGQLNVNKVSNKWTVYMTTTTAAAINDGQSILNLVRGKLQLIGNYPANLTYSSLIIGAGTTFTCTQNQTIYFSGNFTNNQGSFKHNNSTFIFNGTTNTTYNPYFIDTFYNVAIDKSNAAAPYLTISTSDTLYATNKVSYTNGRISSFYVKSDDSVVVSANFIGSTSTLWFTGAKNGHYVCNKNINGPGVAIKKTKSSYYVYCSTSSNGTFNDGSANNLDILSGRVNFNNTKAILSYAKVTISPNSRLELSSDTVQLQSALTNSGRILHNNGCLYVNGASSRAFTFNKMDTFYNVVIDKQNLSSNTITLLTTDSMRVLNKLTLLNGNLTSGNLHIMKDLSNSANFGNVTSNLYFLGSADGTLTMDKALNATNFIVNKSTKTAKLNIVRSTSGSISDGGSGMNIIRGYVNFPNNNDFYALYTTLTIGANGTFKCPYYGNLFFDANLTNTAGGKLIHNNCNWVLDGAVNKTFDVNNSDTFYSVAVKKSSNAYTWTIASSDTMIILNTLNINIGNISTGYIKLLGNLTSANTFGTSKANLTLAGNSSTYLDLTGITGSWDGNITISKKTSKSTVLLKSPLLMDFAATSLTFVKGSFISTATEPLIIGNNVSASGFGDSSYVQGPVRKDGTQAFTFPVGSNQYYAPIGMTAPTSATCQFTATYFKANPGTTYSLTTHDNSIHHLGNQEYWTLNNGGSAASAKVILYWDSKRSGLVTNTAKLLVCHWTNNNWKNEGSGSVTVGSTTAKGSITSANTLSTFSPFTFGSTDASNPLPVELISFNAKATTHGNDLTWETASEINNDKFIIERADNSTEFKAIGEVKGNGTTQNMNNYQFNDNNLVPGVSYYRLKQMDFNGQFEYSKVVAVRSNIKAPSMASIKIYPNPAVDSKATILINIEKGNTSTQFAVVDVMGRILLNQSLTSDANGNINYNLEGLNLRKGLYFIQVVNGDHTELITERLVIR